VRIYEGVYLDHHLLEFTATIPSHLKLHGPISKFILKEVTKEFLPEEILRRPKHPFEVPIGKWLRGSLRDLTLYLISDGMLQNNGLLNEEYVLGEMWHGLEEDRPGYAWQFWSLVNLELWARQFSVRVA